MVREMARANRSAQAKYSKVGSGKTGCYTVRVIKKRMELNTRASSLMACHMDRGCKRLGHLSLRESSVLGREMVQAWLFNPTCSLTRSSLIGQMVTGYEERYKGIFLQLRLSGGMAPFLRVWLRATKEFWGRSSRLKMMFKEK